jgi:hypothetical protein
MKTWEMIKMLSENAELKAIQINGELKGTIVKVGKSGFREPCIVTKEGNTKTILLEAEWELVREPVDFMKAAKAYAEGKTIKCVLNEDDPVIYKPRGDNFGTMRDKYDSGLSSHEILNGKWYIED